MVMAAKQNLILGGPGISSLVSKPCRVSETEVLDMALTSTRGGFGAASSVRFQSVPTAPSVETRFLGLGAFVFAWRLDDLAHTCWPFHGGGILLWRSNLISLRRSVCDRVCVCR